MVVHRDDPLLRVPMSWEQYLELPERPRAEWVHGTAVIVNAPPTFGHGGAMVAIGAELRAALPRFHVVAGTYLRISDDITRLPDLMVTDVVPPDGWVSEPPLLAVEVLSPSTAQQDRVDKAAEYAAFGVGQYWLVDAQERTIEVMRNVEGCWHVLATLDDEHPELTVVVGGTAMSLDLRQVLGN